jgi:hypothetical protein
VSFQFTGRILPAEGHVGRRLPQAILNPYGELRITIRGSVKVSADNLTPALRPYEQAVYGR